MRFRPPALSLLLATALALPAAAQPAAPEVLRIAAPDAATRDALAELAGHLVVEPDSGDVLVEADGAVHALLARLALDWRRDEAASAGLAAQVQGASRSIPGYACFRTVEETLATIDTLVAAHPTLASYVDIGESWQAGNGPNGAGWPLRVLRLGNSAIPGDKPRLFAMSAVHAREYSTAELMTRFAEQLLAGHGVDAEATWLLDHNEFHLLLQANPDGRKRAETGILWRKNQNTQDGACSTNPPNGNSHPGIDLNRNYPWRWGIGTGSSTIQCSGTFRGPSPASEPETQAVRDYVTAIFPDTRPGDPLDPAIAADPDTRGLFLDVHSYSRLVLWPWGYSGSPVTGNDAALVRLGRRLAWFTEYTPQRSLNLYATNGTTIDFAYGELGVPAYTMELGLAFFEDCAYAEQTLFPDNLAALRYASRSLHAPYRLPAGPDADQVAVDLARVPRGSQVTVTARIDDNRLRNVGGTNPSPQPPPVPVIGARLYVGSLPWQDGATGLEMAAADGGFDAITENVRLDLDTSGLAPGRHLLYVQGRTTNGAGPPAAVFLEVIDGDRLFADGFESP
ncbi:MAG: hypothetical protein KF823_06845 [Xanthomonadales bacterium]|nr:hypothetical protein [Xanthomonadales bacterium]